MFLINIGFSRPKNGAKPTSIINDMKYSILFLFMLNFTISNVFSQRIITGRVVDFDTEKPIEGAIIRSNESRVITKSNHLGYFQFNAEVTDTIQIRRKGYAISNFALPDKNHLM